MKRVRVSRDSVLAYSLDDPRILRRNFETNGRQGMTCLERHYEDEELEKRTAVTCAQTCGEMPPR